MILAKKARWVTLLYYYAIAYMAFLVTPVEAAAKQRSLDVTAIAPGIFVHRGEIEPMTGENLGDIANIGFIVGDDCVAVIDTGGSPQVGAGLKAAVEAHTDTPVCYVINTHAHPDHVLGNNAFTAYQPTFVAHENFAAALGARMQTYLDRFSQMYGQHLSPDVMVPPDRTVTDTITLNLGQRNLRLMAVPTGHTNSDLIVLDTKTETLWTGDTLFADHIPILDGSIVGWLRAMDRLKKIDAERAVPGHGPVSVPWPQGLAPQRQYLNNIAAGIRKIIDRGGMIDEAVDQVGYEARDQWLLFEEYHRRNVTTAFAELEWE